MMTWMVEGILVIAIVTIMYSMVAAWRVSTRLVSPRIKEGASTVRGKGQAGAGTGEEMPYQLSPGIRIYRPQFAAIRFSHRDRNSGLKSVLRAGSNGDCDSFLTHRAGATA